MDRHAEWDVTVLHVTDGSPRDGRDARAAGLSSRKAYAAARRRELRSALGLLRRGRRRLRVFSYVDKESLLHLPEIITGMAGLIEALRPEMVMSPAYEGGHPDHDAAAFAVAMARRRLGHRFVHREFPLYHAGPMGEMVCGAFLPGGLEAVETLRLTDEERDKKRRMLAAFATQAGILSRFEVAKECFRDAPQYDFARPPHEGTLLYELWDIGVSGAEWRRRAAEAS
jgi:LmbE family N-acetylglucosaminyl deacetylase